MESRGGWCSIEVHGWYGLGLWKGWGEFSSHIIFEVRDAPKLDSGMTFGVEIEL